MAERYQKAWIVCWCMMHCAILSVCDTQSGWGWFYNIEKLLFNRESLTMRIIIIKMRQWISHLKWMLCHHNIRQWLYSIYSYSIQSSSYLVWQPPLFLCSHCLVRMLIRPINNFVTFHLNVVIPGISMPTTQSILQQQRRWQRNYCVIMARLCW